MPKLPHEFAREASSENRYHDFFLKQITNIVELFDRKNGEKVLFDFDGDSGTILVESDDTIIHIEVTQFVRRKA